MLIDCINYLVLECPTVLQPTSTPNTGSETIISTSKFAVCIISAVVGGVVLGLFCGILLNRKKYRRQNSKGPSPNFDFNTKRI